MDLNCPKCKTGFLLDDYLVSSKDTLVECTKCGEIFNVFPLPFKSSQKPSQKPWIIKTQAGRILIFNDLHLIKDWISKEKISKEDQISRTGRAWRKIESVPELLSLFEKPKIANQKKRKTPPLGISWKEARIVKPILPFKKKETFKEDKEKSLDLKDIPPAPPEGFVTSSHLTKKEEPSPLQIEAWELNSSLITTTSKMRRELLSEEELKSPRMLSKNILAILGICISILLVIGISLFIFQKDKIIGLLVSKSSLSESKDKAFSYYLKGKEYFLLDTPKSFLEAKKKYEDAIKINKEFTLAFAGLAEIYSTWSQYLLDEINVLSANVEELNQKNTLSQGSESLTVLKTQLKKMQQDLAEKLKQAQIFAEDALVLNPNSSEAHRAIADFFRITGNLKAAKKHFEKAKKIKPNDLELLYVRAMIYLAEENKKQKGYLLLKKIIKQDPKLLRARYRLAFLEFTKGNKTQAITHLKKNLLINPEHKWSQNLIQRIKEKQKLASVVTTVAAENQNTASFPPQPKQTRYKGYQFLVRQGEFLQERGRTKEAINTFKKALELNPRGPEALTGLGYCYLDKKNYSAAISNFKEAIRTSSYGPAYIGLAEVFQSIKEFKKSLVHYQKYLKLNPHGTQALMAKNNIEELKRKLKIQNLITQDGGSSERIQPSIPDAKIFLLEHE
jgi:predicted Zn finger-like uncharacterized protein